MISNFHRAIPWLSTSVMLACGLNTYGLDGASSTSSITLTSGSTNAGSTSHVTTTTSPTEANGTSQASAESTATTQEVVDLGAADPGGLHPCDEHGACSLLDILFVIDNSSTMGEEQRILTAAFPSFIQGLRELTDKDGLLVNADVNIMVTTTDFGHPLCTPFQKPGYMPAKGAPISTACTTRLERFDPIDGGAPIPEACTDGCTEGSPVVPDGPFLHFDAFSTNIVGDDGSKGDLVADALACIVPQGVDGCGYEAPLETMLQALNPAMAWNTGAAPFLRPGAVLALVILTDEEDCSTKDYKYFDPNKVADPSYNKYWEDIPGMPGKKSKPTSAVCWNAGTSCSDANDDNVYEGCVSADNGVLQPTERYISYFDYLLNSRDKQVVMLGVLGVPPATQHSPVPPFEPTNGAIFDLVYHDWSPADILPGDPDTPAQKQYDFGIGPGCTNSANGQAIPPVRVREVCESLNTEDDPNTGADDSRIRCCMESICDSDLSNAMRCLVGILKSELHARG